MKFTSVFTLLVFILFALLCGAELADNFKASANKDMASVLYVRSVKSEEPAVEEKPVMDLQKMLEASDVEG